MTTEKTLYERLGGYDAIAAVTNDLLPRLRDDPQLGRFWAHRGDDGAQREKQLLIDYLCAAADGPLYYPGARYAAHASPARKDGKRRMNSLAPSLQLRGSLTRPSPLA